MTENEIAIYDALYSRCPWCYNGKFPKWVHDVDNDIVGWVTDPNKFYCGPCQRQMEKLWGINVPQ